MSTHACATLRDVDDHFRGAIAPSRERALRRHLPSCTHCRRRYQRLALLAKLDPEAIAPMRRLAGGLGLSLESDGIHEPVRLSAAPTRPSLPRRYWAETSLVLAVAAAFLLLVVAPPRDPGQFASRGGLRPSAVVAPALRVYRITEGGAPTPMTDALGRDDELAFAYENVDRKPWLALFAVDERGRVYWLYPGWTVASDDPPAIAAETTPGMHELPEAVRHHFQGSRVDFHAVFLDKPLTVRQIEAEMGKGLFGGHVTSFTVAP